MHKISLLVRLHKIAGESEKTKMATKANNKRFWTVRINFRWTDISFQFTDAEEAAVFAQNALDNFAPHCSDYYRGGEAPKLTAKIDILTAEENDEKMQEFLRSIKKEENAEE